MTSIRNLWAILIIPFVVVADQMSKLWILGQDQLNARNCLDFSEPCGKIEVSGIFDITMHWNRGISFGLFQAEGLARWGLSILMIVIAGFFFRWLTKAEGRLLPLSLALVVGGAIGNVIDRIRFGGVVDFLDFTGLWPPYIFNYIFNVADSAISVGAVLLFADQFLLSRKTETGTPSPDA